MVMKLLFFGFFALLSVGIISPSFAHTTVEVIPYEIEVGWGIEPPVVGFRNAFVFDISEPGENPGVAPAGPGQSYGAHRPNPRPWR